MGFIKWKSAIHVARHFLKRERNYAGQAFWARGFVVDTVDRDTEQIRRHIQSQKIEDKRLEQLKLPVQPDAADNRKDYETTTRRIDRLTLSRPQLCRRLLTAPQRHREFGELVRKIASY